MSVCDRYFIASYYLNKYNDVLTLWGGSAFSHFDQHGQYENRQPSQYFDPAFYLNKYADILLAVQQGKVTAYDHFCVFGDQEMRQPTADFFPEYYKAQYSVSGLVTFHHVLHPENNRTQPPTKAPTCNSFSLTSNSGSSTALNFGSYVNDAQDAINYLKIKLYSLPQCGNIVNSGSIAAVSGQSYSVGELLYRAACSANIATQDTISYSVVNTGSLESSKCNIGISTNTAPTCNSFSLTSSSGSSTALNFGSYISDAQDPAANLEIKLYTLPSSCGSITSANGSAAVLGQNYSVIELTYKACSPNIITQDTISYSVVDTGNLESSKCNIGISINPVVPPPATNTTTNTNSSMIPNNTTPSTSTNTPPTTAPGSASGNTQTTTNGNNSIGSSGSANNNAQNTTNGNNGISSSGGANNNTQSTTDGSNVIGNNSGNINNNNTAAPCSKITVINSTNVTVNCNVNNNAITYKIQGSTLIPTLNTGDKIDVSNYHSVKSGLSDACKFIPKVTCNIQLIKNSVNDVADLAISDISGATSIPNIAEYFKGDAINHIYPDHVVTTDASHLEYAGAGLLLCTFLAFYH